ncbi:MAG TPA: hypothetical protein VFH48_17530 [Chloroflexota bacterium]|nr:hypothetical protein [Chloroflexota bacterium]
MPTTIGGVARQVRGRGVDAARIARLTRDLPRFLRRPISLGTALQHVRGRLATREARFLTLVERGIYGHPRSPYRKLLACAGCEIGDFRALLAHEGIEGTLRVLADRGVYLAVDEQKGYRPVIRGSQRIEIHHGDFDNPLVPKHFSVYSSGSGGQPSRIARSLPQIAEVSETVVVVLDAHGIHDPRHVVWLTGPVNKLLNYAKLGHECVAWFYPLPTLPLEVRAGRHYLAWVGRLGGYRFPPPDYLDLHQPERLAAWLASERADGRPILVSTTASSSVRVAVAAAELGISLDHVAFHAQGEPVTEVRRRAIEAVGARVIVNYGGTEVNSIAYGCVSPGAVDDVHLFHDRWALITRRRAVFEGGPEVDALLFTALSPRAPHVSLNAEVGDYARVATRDCGCKLGEFGLRTHLSDIRSFEKLTGEGMTVVRTNIVRVLEEVLPSRFGGSSIDYQLVEQEGPDGATRLVLRVHPAVGPLDESVVRAALLDGIKGEGLLDSFMSEMWRRAGTVTVSREPPAAGPGGKTPSIQLLTGSAVGAAGRP